MENKIFLPYLVDEAIRFTKTWTKVLLGKSVGTVEGIVIDGYKVGSNVGCAVGTKIQQGMNFWKRI
jgi:hypothetical protein